MMWHQRADVVVIGTGVAGLVAALAAHRRGRNVVVLSKAADTATFYAQGGIAVVLPDTDDSIDAHVADTIAAGAGLCDPDAVRSIVADGYRAVVELVDDGARFDEAEPGRWSLTREGGHSRRRIIHSGGDATGAEVQRALDHAAATLDIRRNHVALQILQTGGAVKGVLVLNEDGLGIVHAPSVVLATGGLGHLYSATTNPEGSTGDGVALALWAGVPVSDIEFIQFHPTMLFDGHAGGRRPLITEAVRGEGGFCLTGKGNRSPRAFIRWATWPRVTSSRRRSTPGSGKPAIRAPTWTPAASPTSSGDSRRSPRPAGRPASIRRANRFRWCPGRTTAAAASWPTCTAAPTFPGLFAAGEVARTGMHGANRLASNSLLEGLVVGGRAGKAAAQHAVDAGPAQAELGDVETRVALPRKVLQRAMSQHASVVRDARGPAAAHAGAGRRGTAGHSIAGPTSRTWR